MRSEKLQEAAFAEAEGAVELAARVGDAGNVGIVAEVVDFLAGLEHVDEHQGRVLVLRLLLEILEAAQDLAGEGAAEVAEENQHERAFGGGIGEGFPGGKLVNSSGLRGGVGLRAGNRNAEVGTQREPEDDAEWDEPKKVVHWQEKQ